MKELVIIVGTIILGCIIFEMIAGDQDSLRSSGREAMQKTIEMYEEQQDMP
jgi:hypothetical protein